MEEWPLLVALMEECPMNPMMCPFGPTVFTADLNLWGAPGHACGCKAGQACQAHLGWGFITVDSEDPRSPWHSGNSNPELGNAIKHNYLNLLTISSVMFICGDHIFFSPGFLSAKA